MPKRNDDYEGPLTCECMPPTYPREGDECPRCRRLVLHDADRIAYLRARKATLT